MDAAFFKRDRALMPINYFPYKPQAKAGSIGIVTVAAALIFIEKELRLIRQGAIALILYPDDHLIVLSVAIDVNRGIGQRVFLRIIK